MSKYLVKGALREVKNYTKGFSDIQAKVRAATSNDPWGPSGTMMNEISAATYNHHEFIEIMEMVDKRLNDSGKNWRHVFKALTVLDYCIHSGSENVVRYARENLYIVKTLREFQFIDEDGKDQGANVRQKAKDITSLLSDNDRLQQERRTRNAMRDRMGGGSDLTRRVTTGSGGGGGGGGGHGDDEDGDLQRAIEESKKSAQDHAKKMRASDDDLRTAIKMSGQENEDQARRQNQNQNNIDFFGNPPINQNTSFDPFESIDANRNGQQNGQQDLFGLAFNDNQNFNNTNPYQSYNPYNNNPPAYNNGNDNNSAFGAPSGVATNQATNPFGASFGGAAILNQATGSSTPFGGFGAASTNNPSFIDTDFTGDSAGAFNAAKGNGMIDPFANVASAQRGNSNNTANNPFAASLSDGNIGGEGLMAPMGQTRQQTGQQQPSSNQAMFPSGLPAGSQNIVNLDSLGNAPFAQSSRNPFAVSSSSSTASSKKYDWGAGSSGGDTFQARGQRTLAELASSSSAGSGGNFATGNMKTGGAPMMTGGGAQSGFNNGNSPFRAGGLQPQQQLQQQQTPFGQPPSMHPFGNSGPFGPSAGQTQPQQAHGQGGQYSNANSFF